MELKPAKMALTTRDEQVYAGLKAAHRAGTPFVTGGAPYLVVSLNVWFDGTFAARAELVEFKQLEWNGEGLPPAGLAVEWHSDSNTGWQEATVLAYHGDYAWIQPKGKPSIIVGNPANFRPIRTPEQIAAEKRGEAIAEIAKASGLRMRDGAVEVATALYAAGYRKQVAP